jgi:P-loop Domain of unknown function (DUF2791)
VLKERVDHLRAVEALRAGVPNRDVVRQLPPLQEEIERRFQSLLEATDAGWMEEKQVPGLLLEGDFGTGKSHWLEYFEHVALENNFVCSRVVVNKERPLHDLAKVCRACVESAIAPAKIGPVIPEIILSYRADRAPGYQELFDWTHRSPGIDPRFGATLRLFERSVDPEVRRRIVDEWIGDPMRVSDLRAALREIGEWGSYTIARPLKGQTLLRFEFLSRFFSSAGYAGWVVLLDEAEMISKYSLRQRGRAYAHLAQLLGLVRGARIPGLACVATITKDYAGQVLYGRKNDIENIPARLQGTKDAEFIAAAEVGMRAIKSKAIELRPPTRAQLQEVYQRVRDLYAGAYRWDAPEISGAREYSSSTGMRQYVRSWINIWDLRRLYDYQADVVIEEERISYEEDVDFQTEPPEAAEEPIITT